MALDKVRLIKFSTRPGARRIRVGMAGWKEIPNKVTRH